MAPFQWPEMKHKPALAKEVAKYFPEKPQEWDMLLCGVMPISC